MNDHLLTTVGSLRHSSEARANTKKKIVKHNDQIDSGASSTSTSTQWVSEICCIKLYNHNVHSCGCEMGDVEGSVKWFMRSVQPSANESFFCWQNAFFPQLLCPGLIASFSVSLSLYCDYVHKICPLIKYSVHKKKDCSTYRHLLAPNVYEY